MPIEVAVVGPDDYERLAAFLAEFPARRPASAARWLALLRAWWDRNPAFDESLPRGWVVREDGRIGGFFGSLPLKFQAGFREVRAFAALHWYVLPAYRGQSLQLRLRPLDLHKQAIHFSTTPKADRLPLLKRLGYRPIPRGPGTELQSHFLLDVRKFLGRQARARLLRGPGAAVAAPVLALAQAYRTRRLVRQGEENVRVLSRADASFDDLWQRTRTRYANTNVRTAELVNWYCFTVVPSDKTLLGFYERDVLLGYMILWRKTDPGRRFLECVDLWIDPSAGEARVLAGLVSKAIACARDDRAERVIFPHFDTAMAERYRDLGLLQGPRWTKREFFKAPPQVMADITVENSYFVWAQGDYGLAPIRDAARRTDAPEPGVADASGRAGGA